jgi:hypothetical protein
LGTVEPGLTERKYQFELRTSLVRLDSRRMLEQVAGDVDSVEGPPRLDSLVIQGQ